MHIELTSRPRAMRCYFHLLKRGRAKRSHGCSDAMPTRFETWVVGFCEMTERLRARQEQLEADVRRTWPEHNLPQEVHSGYTRELAPVIPFKSRRNNGGGGGSRTPVRKALRHEAYMLSSIPFGSPATLRMSKKRSRLVRWFSPEPYGPKGPGQLTV